MSGPRKQLVKAINPLWRTAVTNEISRLEDAAYHREPLISLTPLIRFPCTEIQCGPSIKMAAFHIKVKISSWA